ncbi:MAG: hypothetical protein IPJ17_02745 [Holophagales bacterium]|nr:MAG: hypothetical protein IPJ17_02745 [Holophagales bacterium]
MTSLVGVGVALAVFLGLLAAVAGRRTPSLVLGLLRIVVSGVVAPWRYMRRLAGELADLGESGDKLTEHRGLYLLHKLLDLEKAALLMLGIVILAGGAVVSWNALLPEEWLRKQRAEVRKGLDEARESLAAKELELQAQAPLAESRVAAALVQYRAPREAAQRAARGTMSSLESELRQSAEAKVLFDFVLSETSQAGARTAREIGNVHRRLRARMEAASWAGGAEGPLVRWLDAWKDALVAEVELAGAEAAVRAEETKAQVELSRTIAGLKTRMESLEVQSKEIDAQYHPRWGRSAVTLGGVVVLFLVVVWGLGVLVEIGGMWIALAGDVGEIKHALKDSHGG